MSFEKSKASRLGMLSTNPNSKDQERGIGIWLLACKYGHTGRLDYSSGQPEPNLVSARKFDQDSSMGNNNYQTA